MGEQTSALSLFDIQSETAREDSILRLYCLGSFQVYRPGESQPFSIRSRHKLWTLLKYLIAHSGKNVPTQEVLETLWPNHEDPTDTAPLRTSVSRLKSILQPNNIYYGKNPYIIYSKDSCEFNSEAPYWLDAAEFEKGCRTAHRIGETNQRKALELYFHAFSLYRGDFLADDRLLEWTTPYRQYFQNLFLESVREAADWTLEMKEFSKASRILKKATEIEPFDEKLQIMLLKTLADMADYKAAAKHYTFYSNLVFQKQGRRPSDAVETVYREVQKKLGPIAERKIIRENPDVLGEAGGPFICDPDLFWNLLLLERRRLSRNGGEASLVILELKNTETAQPGKGLSIRNLEAAARDKLRKSDIICRLNDRQLALLLPMTGSMGSQLATGYIQEYFQTLSDQSGITLWTKIKRITPLAD